MQCSTRSGSLPLFPAGKRCFFPRTIDEYSPMVTKHGGKTVGTFQTVFGNSGECFYVLEWDDLAHRDRVLKLMRKDADYQEMAARWAEEPSVSNVFSRIVKPPAVPFLSSAAGTA
ncbi:NIPSNAP family protein [Chloroflexota bacterium]